MVLTSLMGTARTTRSTAWCGMPARIGSHARFAGLRRVALAGLGFAVGCSEDDDAPSGEAIPTLNVSSYTEACAALVELRVDCGLISETELSPEAKACVLSFAPPNTWCDHARLATVQCERELTCEQLAEFPADPTACGTDLAEETETCAAQ